MRRTPGVQQPPGSFRCLPAAVLSALLWLHDLEHPTNDLNLDSVGAWCRESELGCIFDLAVDGLAEAGIDRNWDIEVLSSRSEEMLAALVADEDNYTPLVVLLQNPDLDFAYDHAVVLCDIYEQPDLRIASYMDPLTGQMESAPLDLILRWWNSAGRRAFRIVR